MNEAYGSPYTVAQAEVSERAAFIRRVYAHLAGAILALICIDFVLLQIPAVRGFVTSFVLGKGAMLWLGIIAAFGVINWLAMTFATSPKSKGMQYVGLAIYTLSEALILLPMLIIAQVVTKDSQIILQAGICTMAVFVSLTMVAFFTKADFSFFKSFLMVGGLVAIAAIVSGAIFGFGLGVWFSAAMVLLASISILYNTSNLIHHYSTDQHVAASLSLLGSIVLLFWYILRIFLAFRD